eukprot:4300767-Pleurochrysis_carterae.AAC.1
MEVGLQVAEGMAVAATARAEMGLGEVVAVDQGLEAEVEAEMVEVEMGARSAAAEADCKK